AEIIASPNSPTDKEKRFQVKSNSLTVTTSKKRLKIIPSRREGGERGNDEILTDGSDFIWVEVRLIGEDGEVVTTDSRTKVNLELSDDSLGKAEEETLQLSQGTAETKIFSTKKAGIWQLVAAEENGLFASSESLEIFSLAQEAKRIELSTSSKIISPQTGKTTVGVKLFDVNNNLADSESETITLHVEGGDLIDLIDFDDEKEGTQSPVFGGMAEFEIETPDQSGQISVRSSLEGGAERALSIRVLEGVRVEVFANKKSLVVDGENQVVITTRLVSRGGQTLIGGETGIDLQVLEEEKGTLESELVQLVRGEGKTKFTTGYKAGEVKIVGSFSGFESGELTLELLPRPAAKIVLTSEKEELDLAQGPFQFRAELRDPSDNLVTNNSFTNIDFKITGATEEFGTLENPRVKATKGIAENEVEATSMLTGNLRIVASASGLISGYLEVPIKYSLTYEDFKRIKPQALYTTFLGAPVGDFTQENYLAGWILFSGGKTQVVTSVTRVEEEAENSKGFGWKGDYKNQLLFAAGNTVGESTRDYASEMDVNLGDPVISLKQSKYRDEITEQEKEALNADDLNVAGFDTSIGSLIYRGLGKKVKQILASDFNNDQLKDLMLISNDGGVRLLKNFNGYPRFKEEGDLLNLPEDFEEVASGDFDNDGFEDVIFSTQKGEIYLYHNQGGAFIKERLELNPVKNVIGLKVADMDHDNYADLVVINGRGEIKIYYGTSQGLGEAGEKIASFPVKIDPTAELKREVFVYHDAVLKSQIGADECRDEECEQYRPAYVSGYGLPNDQKKCSTYFEKKECNRDYYVTLKYTSSEEAAKKEAQKNASPAEIAESYKSTFQKAKAGGTSTEAIENLINNPGAAMNFNYSAADSVKTTADFLKLDQDSSLGIDSSKKGERVGGKIQNTQNLEIGDLVRYTITLKNNTNRSISNLAVTDTLAPLFKFKKESLQCSQCNWDEKKKERILDGEEAHPFIIDNINIRAGRQATITYEVEVQDLPKLILQVGDFESGAYHDDFLDLMVDIEGNTSGQVTYLYSIGRRAYEKSVSDPQSPPQDAALQTLSQKSASISSAKGQTSGNTGEDESKKAFAKMNADDDGDGLPNYWDDFSGMTKWERFSGAKDAVTKTLSGAADMADEFADKVEEELVKAKCGGGCVVTPINMAFLAPGMINILGIPGGFDPGLPIFAWGIPSLIPIWPPSPYQGSIGRIYIAPTLTGAVGMGICTGAWLAGQCQVFVPKSMQMDDYCENEDIQGFSDSVTALSQAGGALSMSVSANVGTDTAGNSVANVDPRVNVGTMGGSGIDEGAAGGVEVGYNNGTFNYKVIEGANFSLPAFPAFFSDWMDRQTEEIWDALTDLPDIKVILPDLFTSAGFTHAFGGGVFDLEGMDFFEDLLAILNSIPLVNIRIEKIYLKIPWIEPNLIPKIEKEVSGFMIDFFREIREFIHSFDQLTCGTTSLGEVLESENLKKAEKEADEALADFGSGKGSIGASLEKIRDYFTAVVE
ncbi:MAG TPA: DUF11 domain-containing protein, partial [Candidatus Peregrinibacteria bacterium]|nr:DUF11 domain-containing protein [Candidatus Peregrinibacteria bacterium]